MTVPTDTLVIYGEEKPDGRFGKIFKYLKVGYVEDDGRLFFVTTVNRKRNISLKLWKGKFSLDNRKNFLITRVVKY